MNNYFDRQKGVLGEDVGDKIKKAKILIVGVGAGGNEVLKNLVLMGFGLLTIVDHDDIEDSNLSRTTLFKKSDIGKNKAIVASYVLECMSLHEKPSIIGLDKKIEEIGKQIFLEHDIVISCVDSMDARGYINDWCLRFNKPFFEMGFDKFVIQVSFFPNESPNDPCLREIIGYGNDTGKRNSCSKLKVEDNKLSYIPTIQVSAAFAGVFIATEIILFLSGESSLKNKILQYSAKIHNLLLIDVKQNKSCFNHEKTELQFHNTRLNPFDNTFRDLLNELKNKYGSDYYVIWDEEYIYSMRCESCKKEIHIKRFKSQVYDHERWCDKCISNISYTDRIEVSAEWVMNSEMNLHNINYTFFLDLKIIDYGIKEKDVIIFNDLYDNEKKIFVLI
jgi:molybdopterin/thiamine biosynthesis adenylyltransferase